MSTWHHAAAVAVLAILAGTAHGQTAVQLPTFSHFGVGTTVSVPDRGSASMGGVNRASSGANEFGMPLSPLRNRSMGSERSSNQVGVSVYIHDLEAMDEALLSQPTAYSARTAAAKEADQWKRRVASGTSEPRGQTGKSLDELKADNARKEQLRGDEVGDLLARGEAAEASGKANVAKIYYQMASRRATGPQKDLADGRLRRLQTGSSVKLAKDGQ